MFCNPMAASNLSSFSFSLRSRIKKSSLSYLAFLPFPNQENPTSALSFGQKCRNSLPLHHHHNLRTGKFTSVGQGSSFLANPCQVKSEDSEGTIGSDDIALDEQTLEQELQKAIEEENYALAATLRDRLKLRQMDSKASVLAANGHFYKSFRNGDLATMQALWAKGDHVCCVHPGVSGISGYDLVMGSWEFVWADYEFPLEIELKDVQVHVRGDLGYVTCVELVKTKGSSWGRQFATNVFERIDGEWYICIHHASYVDL